MKMKTKLLAAAVAAACITGGTAQAAELPALLTRTLDNSPSEAAFAGGVTINNGASFLQQVPASETFTVFGSIDVDSDAVGQEGDLYQIALVNAGGMQQWFQRTSRGLQRWDGRVANLQPFTTKTLAPREVMNLPPVSLRDIEGALGRSLDGASIRVHMGYATDSSILTYSQAMNFQIAPPPSSSCPAPATALGMAGPSGKSLCLLAGTYRQDLHLTANFDYVISGAVFIGGDNSNTAALTIDAGTTLYGESGNDFLVINRGSKIHANGSPARPIIMTSASDATATATTRGQWGGLIINGNAPINGCSTTAAVCEAEGEGSTGRYGGNNPADSSGNLNYLQVKYAGYEITPENELNGIAFQGVGSGTNVDYVQVHNNSDDGVEFFGGTVNAKHLVLTGIGDDSVDWTMGWQGKLQHVVVVQGTDRGGMGIEADNNSNNRDSLPRSRPTIANITLIGSDNTGLGVLLREGTAGNISNAVVTGFGDACLDIDHDATFANAGSSATALSGQLTMTHSAVDCLVNFEEEVGDNWSVASWFNNQAGNVSGGLNMLPQDYINSPTVNSISPALMNDSFFDQTDYIGAVRDPANDWTLGWTYWD